MFIKKKIENKNILLRVRIGRTYSLPVFLPQASSVKNQNTSNSEHQKAVEKEDVIKAIMKYI